VRPPAAAQQVSGVLGTPGATTTIDGKQLPPPPPPFGGVIKELATDSRPGGRPCRTAQGAPNVLLIMTDDQGYGVSGTGVIPAPALDRIAKAGLRYTSSTHRVVLAHRAALITGRNHHSVGNGVISGCRQGTRL
jgi:arylsulfatase